MRQDPDGRKWAQLAADLKADKADAALHEKNAAAIRERLLFLAKDNERVLLPGATLKLRTQHIKEHMRKASTHVNLSVEVDETFEQQELEELPDGTPI